MTARLTIDTERVRANAALAVERAAALGAEVMGVTKGVCGHAACVRAMLDGGVKALGDSRLANIARMRVAGIDTLITLLRSPALSEVLRCVELADASLNASVEILRALAAEAQAVGKTHGVTLMLDVDGGREGFRAEELPEVCRLVAELRSLDLRGLGVYFTQPPEPAFAVEKLRELARLAEALRAGLGVALPVLSGGSSNVFGARIAAGESVDGVNEMRLGTLILLGLDSPRPEGVPGFHTDTMALSAELIEVKRRERTLGILALGKLDAEPAGLFPIDPGVGVLRAFSDHTVVDLTEANSPCRVGDYLDFRLGYSAMSRLMMSEYVSVVEARPAPATDAGRSAGTP